MKKKLIYLSVLTALSASFSHSTFADEKKLTFYQNMANYKEIKEIDPKQDLYLTLTNTAIIDTFNVSLIQDDKVIKLDSLQIHPSDEENIFILNKGSIVKINGEKYLLIDNGKGFVKVKSEDGFITFIPKSNIKEIGFKNDLKTTDHLVKVLFNRETLNPKNIVYSYNLGELSWVPRYNLYFNKDAAFLDYNIEIKNDTLTSFEDVKVEFMLEDIERYYTKFKSDYKGGIFEFNHNINLNVIDKETRDNIANDLAYIKREIDSLDRSFHNNTGFDRDGYSRDGFNRQGSFSGQIFNALKGGKRTFYFENTINIPSKASTIFPYKNNLNIDFNKKNYASINSLSDDLPLVPYSKLVLKNNVNTPLLPGVIRIFSDKKGTNNTPIKEEKIKNEIKKDSSFDIDLGYNHNINYKLKKESLTKNYNFPDFYICKKQEKETYVDEKYYNENYISFFKEENETTYRQFNLTSIYKFDFHLMQSNNEKKLILNDNSKIYLKEKDFHYFTNLVDFLKTLKNKTYNMKDFDYYNENYLLDPDYFKKEEHEFMFHDITKDEFNKLKELVSDFYNHTTSEIIIDLENDKNKVFYQISLNKKDLTFNKNNYGKTMSDLEKSRKDFSIEEVKSSDNDYNPCDLFDMK